MDELDRNDIPSLESDGSEMSVPDQSEDTSATDAGSSDTPPADTGAALLDPAEDPVHAVIRLTAEHAAAAAAGSPEQVWLLMARKAASRAVREGDYSMLANLAVRSPSHLAVVEADARQLTNADVNLKRVTTLVFGNIPEHDQANKLRMTDPAEIYIRTKQRFAALSQAAQAGYSAAAELDVIAKSYAQTLVNGGRIVNVAMQSESLALTALGDAGLARALVTPAEIRQRTPLAQAWLDADLKVMMALNAHDWTAYGPAADARLAAMKAIAGDPLALVALGRLASDQSHVSGKIAADFAIVRAGKDAQAQNDFQKNLKTFEASFAKDLTIEGSDPVKRWIKVQNEIERQERGADPKSASIAYLRKISEKTALEAAANPRDWARLQQTRPDLVQRLVQEANKGKESLRTINKETTIAKTTTGDFVVNEAAVARNKGDSPEIAAAKAGALPLDRQTNEIRAQQKAAGQTPPANQVDGKAPATISGLRADPADRIGGNPGAKKPAPANGQSTSNGQSGQAPNATQSSTPGAAAQPANPQPRNAAQAEAMKHTNTRFSGFDVDTGEYSRKMGRDLALFVNARTPYNLTTFRGQVNDPRKKVLALPLNSFANDKIWTLKKELRKIATEEPARFFEMYQVTKDTYHSWQDVNREADLKALDQLELGRRLLAEVGMKAGVLKLDKIVKQPNKMRSQAGKSMDLKSQLDPHGFIKNGEHKKLSTYYMAMAATAAHAKAKEFHKNSWSKLKLNIAGDKARGKDDISFGEAMKHGGWRMGAKVLKGLKDEIAELSR